MQMKIKRSRTCECFAKPSSLLRSTLIRADLGWRVRNVGLEKEYSLAVKGNTALLVDPSLLPTIHTGQVPATCNLRSRGI